MNERIDKLSKINYDTWSITLQSILKSKKLWYLIELGHDLIDEDIEEINKPENKDKPEFATIASKIKLFEDVEKNEEAKSILYTTMSREEIQKTGSCGSAYDLWEKIKENHLGADVDQRNIALSEFLGFEYRKGEAITSYCGRFEIALSRVETSGSIVDESTKFWVFRNKLPNDIKTMANFWLMANPDGRIASLITAMKLQHHLDKQEKEDSNVALYSNATNKPPDQQGTSKSDPKQGGSSKKFCKYCKKNNHVVADCRKRILKEKLKAESSNQEKEKQRFAYNAFENETSTSSPGQWIIDSGASSHMIRTKSSLSNYKDLDTPKTITLGDGKKTFAIGSGEYEFSCGMYEGVLKDVLWVPELNENLFSVGKAIARGIRIEFVNDRVIFKHGDTITMTAWKKQSNMFTINLVPLKNGSEHAEVSIEEWHGRFGHNSIEQIKKLAKSGAVTGLKIDSSRSDHCDDCIAGKITRASHPSRSTIRASSSSAVLQIDTCGPMNIESLGGSKYFVLAIEEMSNYKIIKFVRFKSEIPDVVKEIINQVEIESKRPVKLIQTDNGSEFLNSNLKIFLTDKGILHERSVPFTPEQNGSVERANRVVIEGIRTLIHDSKLPECLWAEAASTVVYTTNRLFGPKSSDKTRYELYHSFRPDVRNLRTFGEPVYVNLPKSKRESKFTENGHLMAFVGYTSRSNTYKVYDPESHIISLSCDVSFNVRRSSLDAKSDEAQIDQTAPIVIGSGEETDGNSTRISSSLNASFERDDGTNKSTSFGENDQDNSSADANQMVSPNRNLANPDDSVIIDLSSSLDDSADQNDPINLEPELASSISNSTEDTAVGASENPVPRRSLRSNTTTDQLVKPNNIMNWFYGQNKESANSAILVSHDEPKSLSEAMESDEWKHWKAAMDEEMAALQKNRTWVLVSNSSKMRTIKSKWIFKIKSRADGSIDRYKARLVAKGYSQIPEIDYKSTFAPVASSNTIRMALALATFNDMELVQFDIKTAFLYGHLEEELFMAYPDGYPNPENKICKLIKSLYGLKQAPRQWNVKFNEMLIKFSLERSNIDKCLYFNKNRSMILIIYVDDGLIISKNKLLLDELVNFLKLHFEIKTMECETYLGFSISRNRKTREMFVHQTGYASKVLSKYGMNDCKPASTPEEVGLSIASDATLLTADYPFKDLVGSLLYLVTCTRPDLAHAVGMASRTGTPTSHHWQRLKRVLRYLKGTSSYGLHFKGGKSRIELVGFADADYANDSLTRRSTSGYVILLCGGPIAWRCQQQPIIALSTTEAEFISGCEMVKDLVPLRNTLIDLKAITDEPTPVYIDNISAVRIANDDGGQKRTKHIDVRYKWLNEQSENKAISIKHIAGTDQAADILTKPLHKSRFQANRSMLMSLLTLIMMLTVMSCESLTKTEPIMFSQSKFKLFNSAELWTVKLIIPNLCQLVNDTLPVDSIKLTINECHANQLKLMRALTHCNGVLLDFDMRMTTRIGLGNDSNLTKPYFATFEGSKLITLDETARGLSKLRDNDRDYLITQLNLKIKDHLRQQIIKYKSGNNQTLVWSETINPLMADYQSNLVELNNQLKNRNLSVASKIWNSNSQSMSQSDEAMRAKLFNCSSNRTDEGIEIDLHFVTTAKSDPAIQFFDAEYFDFYNTTRDVNNTVCWMTYHGPKHIMVNTTNDCMVEVSPKILIDTPTEVQLCEKPSKNLKAYATHLWHKEFCTATILPQKEKVQIKYNNDMAKIYCFPFNVSVDDEVQPCPDFVFEANLTSVYRVAGMELIGSKRTTPIETKQSNIIKEISSVLRFDEIKMSTSKLAGKISNTVAETKDQVVNFMGDVKESVGNLTSSMTNKLSDVAASAADHVTGGLTRAIDTIWTYVKWAGVVLSVIATALLLLLAAPLFEIVFVVVRLIKVPYRKFIRLAGKLLFRWNNSTVEKTVNVTRNYLEKTKNKLNLQRKRQTNAYRMSKLV